MRKSVLFFLIIFSLGIVESRGQTQEWIDYPQGEEVYALSVQGNYLWIATNGGAVRLDLSTGEESFFNRGNSALPSNAVHSLFVEKNNVYFGTECEGLVKFSGNNWTPINSNYYSGVTNYINAISIDSNGKLWVGYQDGGLWSYDGSNWTDYRTWNSSIPSEVVFDIATDSNGVMWVATGGGLVKIKNGNWQVYTPLNSSLPSYYIYAIDIDENGKIWLATADKGVVVFDGNKTWTVFNSSNSGLTSDKILAIEHDTAGKYWIGTEKGLFLYENQTWKNFTVDNSALPSNYVYSLVSASGNRIFVGTLNGLAMYDGISWTTHYKLNNSPVKGTINNILTVQNHSAWIGTSKGLYKYDGNNVIEKFFFGRPVSALAKGANNKMLIGTQQGGLFILDNGSLDTLNDPIISNYNINAITEDNVGNIWISTDYNGLVKYNSGHYEKFSSSDSTLPNDNVSCLLADGNNLWIGTKKGLARLNLQNYNWKVYTPDNSGLPGYGIIQIKKDNTGTLWALVGSYWNGSSWDVGGLAKFTGNGWTAIPRDVSGLSKKSLLSFDIATDNTLWIGTNAGIVKFVGENNFSVYDISNSPIPTNNVTNIALDALNNIWFSTVSGYPGADQSDLGVFNEKGIVLKVKEDKRDNLIARGYFLSQNYPNPFGAQTNNTTQISYSIPKSKYVSLKIYDLLGREVAVLVNSFKTSGIYRLQFNALNLPSGVYFYRLKIGNIVLTRKMVYFK